MPEVPVALVSAEDFVTVLRDGLDRVHDAVRRRGVPGPVAPRLVQAGALDLLEMLHSAPESVGDLLGWWFGRCDGLAERYVGGAPAPVGEPSSGILHGSRDEARLLSALAELPVGDEWLVRLTDAYDLPVVSVGVASGLAEPEVRDRVAAARLALLSAYDGRPAVVPVAHGGPTWIGPGALGQLVDGSLPAARSTALRAHVHRCPACEDVLDAQARARAIVAGLPILAFPEPQRAPLLAELSGAAESSLALEESLFGGGPDRPGPEDAEAPVLSPLVIGAAVALALLVGIVAGLLSR